MAERTYEKRLQRELDKIKASPPPGLSIDGDVPKLTEWVITLNYTDGNGAECLYTGKSFRLRFRFTDKYPMDAPEVIFIDVPLHEHIYSNGHICMDILYDAWTPAMTVSTVAQSIFSMLAGM